MIINLNTERTYKLIPEGDVVVTIKDAKVVPSGAPQRIQLKFVDADGASMFKDYKFENSGAMYYFGQLLSAIGIGDGETFDTNDASKLINRSVIATIKHTEYNGKTYADPSAFSPIDEVSTPSEDTDIAYPEIPATTDFSDIDIDGL